MGKIQCNETCKFTLPSGKEVTARLTEMNWVGFVIDYIDIEFENEIFSLGEKAIFFNFTLPREFGSIQVHTKPYSVSVYQDIINHENKIKMVINIEDKEEISYLQDFISYRNRRFARHGTSRKSIVWLNNQIFLYFIYFIVAVLLLAIGFTSIYARFI